MQKIWRHVVFEICEWTDIQTHTLIAILRPPTGGTYISIWTVDEIELWFSVPLDTRGPLSRAIIKTLLKKILIKITC